MSTQNNLGGSWHVGPDVPGKGINVVTETGGHIVYVADLFGGTDGEQPDIARLIAAAPDLLAALQACALELDRYENAIDNATRIIRSEARAAIAKTQAVALREHNAMECAMGNCPHETGTRRKEFDADGCGYYLWVCNECGYIEHDDMP